MEETETGCKIASTVSMIGRVLSHYRIVAEISRGGMGIVYRASDTRLNRDVALKVRKKLG